MGRGSLGGPGSGPGELRWPTDVAVDHRRRVFVAEFGNHRVQLFGVREAAPSR